MGFPVRWRIKQSITVSVFRKAHMEQVLAQAKVKITPASKIWDAQRAYEKRLATAMSKDKGSHPSPRECTWPADFLPAFAPAKGRKGKRKDTGASSGAEEVESEPEPPAPKKPRPQPRRKSKRFAAETEPEPAPSTDHEGVETDASSDKLTDIEDEDEKMEKDDGDEIEQGEPETPKATRKAGLLRNKGAPQATSSPSPSKGSLGEEDVEMEDIEPALSPAPDQTQEPVVEEVVVRRKRLRA